MICVGAVTRPRYEHALTIGDPGGELAGLTDEIETGRTAALAFVVPSARVWPLPLYEAALMSATLAAEYERELTVTVVTSERAPLEVFGDRAAVATARLLSDLGIEVVTGARCELPTPDLVEIRAIDALRWPASAPARHLAVDRVVAVPELHGPHFRGVPCADQGFIPIDRYCRVPGSEAVYAAGDATDFPIKHGGLAAQQADAVAASIAAQTGDAVHPRPFRPRLQGLLLTGGEPRYLSAWLIDGHPAGSMVSLEPGPSGASKIVAEQLDAVLGLTALSHC